MEKYQGQLLVQYPHPQTGIAAANVGFTVNVVVDGVVGGLATLYQTNSTSGATYPNPGSTTNSSGRYEFYAVNGNYQISFNNGAPPIIEKLIDVDDEIEIIEEAALAGAEVIATKVAVITAMNADGAEVDSYKVSSKIMIDTYVDDVASSASSGITSINTDVQSVQDAADDAYAELLLQIDRAGLDTNVIPYTAGITLDSYTKTYSYDDGVNGTLVYIWRGALNTVTTGDFDETGWVLAQVDIQLRHEVTKGTQLIRDIKHVASVAVLSALAGQYENQYFYLESYVFGENTGGGFLRATMVEPANGSLGLSYFVGASGWFFVRVEQGYSYPEQQGRAASEATGVPVTDAVISGGSVFLDNLRQFNFHTSGAAIDTHTFDMPDDMFRIQEASRSYEKPIGPLESVLVVGDSLSAFVATDGSYTEVVAKQLSLLKGGIRQVGYLAAEQQPISAKQQFFGITISQSGFTYLNNPALPYTDDLRRFSPDGKGAFAVGTGTQFYHWNMNSSPLVNYTKYRIYYLQQPDGGTFDIRNRGATFNAVNTAGSLGIGVAEFPFVYLGSPLNKDVRVENVTGNVCIFGIDPVDESQSSGFSYDVMAISGGALFELLQLEAISLQTICSARNYDTVVINIGTNDSTQGRSVAQFEADLLTYKSRISAVLPNAKFVIVTPNNMQWTNFTDSTRQLYENARRKFSRENELMYIDLPSEVGNFNYFVQMGWMRDGTHPNIKGQQVIGLKIAEKLIKNSLTPQEISQRPLSISNRASQAYCSFNVIGGVITKLSFANINMTYVATGTYDVSIRGVIMADFHYTVSCENPGQNRSHAIASKSATGFRLFVTDMAGTLIDPSVSMSFDVIGTRVLI